MRRLEQALYVEFRLCRICNSNNIIDNEAEWSKILSIKTGLSRPDLDLRLAGFQLVLMSKSLNRHSIFHTNDGECLFQTGETP